MQYYTLYEQIIMENRSLIKGDIFISTYMCLFGVQKVHNACGIFNRRSNKQTML